MRPLISLTLLGVVLGLTACSMPYARPIVAQEPGAQDASFDGIRDLVTQAARHNATLHVIWTHGMCTHDPSWVADWVTRVTTTLGGTAQPIGGWAATGKLMRVAYEFQTPAGTFDSTFILWSPMTASYKQQLVSDNPGTDPSKSFPYQRASLNNDLKVGLINDCLADAVVYAGTNGDPIRKQMKQAVCYALGGRPVSGGPCDLSGAELDRPLAIVTESLGSKFLFDAVRATWDDAGQNTPEQQRLARRLASISMVYMLANQLPLLDLASPVPAEATSGAAVSASTGVPPPPLASSLGRFLDVLRKSHGIRAQQQPSAALPPLTVVAFTDPNDLLSYRLLPSELDVSQARLINVIGSNVPTWFGFVERPDYAHCGYVWNRKVIGLLADGHKVGEPIPESPVLASGQCLSPEGQ